MDYAKLFSYWILAQYFIAACLYARQGDFARTWYWIAAMQIMLVPMLLLKNKVGN